MLSQIRKTPRLLRSGQWATSPMSTHNLRRELGASIDSVARLTSLVQAGITEIKEMCPITNIRAQMYMKRWGLEKFEKIMAKILNARMVSAIHRWRDFVQESIQEEKREQYLQYSGAAKVIAVFKNLEMKMVRL